MSILNKLLLASLIILFAAAARGDGINNYGARQGIYNSGISMPGGAGGSGPPVGCAGTGFNFTLACNSQYLAVF